MRVNLFSRSDLPSSCSRLILQVCHSVTLSLSPSPFLKHMDLFATARRAHTALGRLRWFNLFALALLGELLAEGSGLSPADIGDERHQEPVRCMCHGQRQGLVVGRVRKRGRKQCTSKMLEAWALTAHMRRSASGMSEPEGRRKRFEMMAQHTKMGAYRMRMNTNDTASAHAAM